MMAQQSQVKQEGKAELSRRLLKAPPPSPSFFPQKFRDSQTFVPTGTLTSILPTSKNCCSMRKKTESKASW